MLTFLSNVLANVSEAQRFGKSKRLACGPMFHYWLYGQSASCIWGVASEITLLFCGQTFSTKITRV